MQDSGGTSARTSPRGNWSQLNISSSFLFWKDTGHPALGPDSPHRLSLDQGLNTSSARLPLRRTHPALLRPLPPPPDLSLTSCRVPCSLHTATSPLYTLPISTSLHRANTVNSGRVANPYIHRCAHLPADSDKDIRVLYVARATFWPGEQS